MNQNGSIKDNTCFTKIILSPNSKLIIGLNTKGNISLLDLDLKEILFEVDSCFNEKSRDIILENFVGFSADSSLVYIIGAHQKAIRVFSTVSGAIVGEYENLH
jgi:hypothetical protein